MLPLVLACLLAADRAPPPQGGAATPGAATPQAPGERPSQEQEKSEEQKRLEEEISRQLGAGAAPTEPQPPPAQPPPAPAGQTGGSPLARLLLLPDISAIGRFAAVYDSYDAAALSPRSGPTAEPHKLTPVLEELELAIQSVVDPYARADIFISFSPEEVAVEEAYLTTLSLPAGFQLRGGVLKSPFGRLNQQHPHVWDFVDAPLAMSRLLSAEALSGPGADLAWLAPVPWFLELHLAGQTTVPPGESGERRTVVGRVIQFFDVGEWSALGVGLSGARTESGDLAGQALGGLDVFLKIRPPSTRSYVALQGELFARRYSGTSLGSGSLGGYAQAVWRRSAYWEYGARYDNAPAVVADDGATAQFDGTEHRLSGLVTWLPSEFQRLRLQLAWDRRPDGQDGFEAVLHAEFAIGAHGAHPF